MPKKRCKSCLDLGKGMSLIALTFSGFGEIPFPDILFPKNITSHYAFGIMHFGVCDVGALSPDLMFLVKANPKFPVRFLSYYQIIYPLG